MTRLITEHAAPTRPNGPTCWPAGGVRSPASAAAGAATAKAARARTMRAALALIGRASLLGSRHHIRDLAAVSELAERVLARGRREPAVQSLRREEPRAGVDQSAEDVAEVLGGLRVALQPGKDGLAATPARKAPEIERPLVGLDGPGVAPILVSAQVGVGPEERLGDMVGLLERVADPLRGR